MGLHHLSDDSLKEFIKDPTSFLQQDENFSTVFDMGDKSIKDRLERLQRELWKSPEYEALRSQLTK